MRLLKGSYGPLLIGVAGAIAIVFPEPLSRFLSAVFAAFGVSGIVVIPAMALILLAVLLHEQGRRVEKDAQVKQDAEAMAGDARRAEERARELEHLVRLGEAPWIQRRSIRR